MNLSMDTMDDLIDGDPDSCIQLNGNMLGCTKQDQVKTNSQCVTFVTDKKNQQNKL